MKSYTLRPDTFHTELQCTLSEPFDDCFNLNGTSAQVDRKKLDQALYLLRAFMLRRVKSEVEDKLPPRLETTINVPMSEMQIFWTRRLLMRDAKLLKRVEDRRAGRVGGAGGDTDAVADADAEASDVNGHAAGDWKRLQSLFMQLRKASNHPFLFPGAERTPSWLPATEEIIKASGKMQLLDRLLPKLQAGGHRVVLFSQFTSMLDLLDDYLSMRRVAYCRLDGSTNRVQRQVNIDMFNAPSSELFCFIMSTRAGGLGVNLQTADTVILYDSDWNPQVDLQAQDRAHRIGQTKTVHVYRLITENTIEEKIIERAEMKLRLDAAVIQSGRLSTTKGGAKASKDDMKSAIRYGFEHLYNIQCSEIFTLRNEKLHTEA